MNKMTNSVSLKNPKYRMPRSLENKNTKQNKTKQNDHQKNKTNTIRFTCAVHFCICSILFHPPAPTNRPGTSTHAYALSLWNDDMILWRCQFDMNAICNDAICNVPGM